MEVADAAPIHMWPPPRDRLTSPEHREFMRGMRSIDREIQRHKEKTQLRADKRVMQEFVDMASRERKEEPEQEPTGNDVKQNEHPAHTAEVVDLVSSLSSDEVAETEPMQPERARSAQAREEATEIKQHRDHDPPRQDETKREEDQTATEQPDVYKSQDEVEIILSPMLMHTHLEGSAVVACSDTPPVSSRLRPRAVNPVRRVPDLHAPGCWPFLVVHLADHYNPQGIICPGDVVSGSCGCSSPCRRDTCANGRDYIYCDQDCCPYEGLCGNGIVPLRSLRLVQLAGTDELGVVATRPIAAGVNFEEFLGELSYIDRPTEKSMDAARQQNSGYRLIMTEPAATNAKKCIAIDAHKFGSMIRFVNHSCKLTARFFQVRNGSRHTVVASAIRAIRPGEEITVDYGKYLWFLCRCGQPSCRHRQVKLTTKTDDKGAGNDVEPWNEND